jgi:hypothetical protein
MDSLEGRVQPVMTVSCTCTCLYAAAHECLRATEMPWHVAFLAFVYSCDAMDTVVDGAVIMLVLQNNVEAFIFEKVALPSIQVIHVVQCASQAAAR